MGKIVQVAAAITVGVVFFFSMYLVQGHAQSTGTLTTNNETSVDQGDAAQLFVDANKFYLDEQYRNAALRYERLVQSGLRNGEIYYNLGNTYFKLGMLGKAILHYRLAELYQPRNEDLQANLKYARQLTKDKIEPKQFISFLKEFCFWYSKLNLRELLIVFLIVHGLLWTLALMKIFMRKGNSNTAIFN